MPTNDPNLEAKRHVSLDFINRLTSDIYLSTSFFEAFQPLKGHLETTYTDGHWHTFNEGDSETSTNDGHSHKIVNGVIQETHGHTHLPEQEDEEHAEEYIE